LNNPKIIYKNSLHVNIPSDYKYRELMAQRIHVNIPSDYKYRELIAQKKLERMPLS